ncbi:DedA family protein [Enterobacteriaceae endosymbiont of Donacia dentata]|uniref:DedA family protein n=1 Tax=Enterobacteriaceae endosymbiont of Donacia dentata TaxID=2675777 RepID=UPI0014563CA6|nr:VTT domain-containing protein [Enterobacteriaceae endosymbiont of Donacia dentata]
MLNTNIIKIINHYGYIIILLSSLIEWETFIVIAGMLAHKKILFLNKILFITVIGSIISNQLLFYIGKKYSKKFLFFFKNYRYKIQKYHTIITKYPYIFIITKFIYGFRLLSPIIMGIIKISYLKFFLLNITGSIIWTIFFTITGYFFGEIIFNFIKNFANFIKYFIYFFLLFIIIKFIYKIIKKYF